MKKLEMTFTHIAAAMMPLDKLSRYYNKLLMKHTFVRFECTECQKPVFPRSFEWHCRKEHGIDSNTRCVWCSSSKLETVAAAAAADHLRHRIACFKEFVKRTQLDRAAAAAAAAASAASETAVVTKNSNSSSFIEQQREEKKDDGGSSSRLLRVSHSKCVASLALGTADAFTLFDGRTSVICQGSLDNSRLVREIVSMGIGRLYAADDRTLAKLNDLVQCYPVLSEIDIVEPPPPPPPIQTSSKLTEEEEEESAAVASCCCCCRYCGSKYCDKWKAVDCLSRALGFNFDQMEHGPKTIVGCR